MEHQLNPPPDSDADNLAEAVQRLVRALRPERIYLFGSQARGEATYDSDYDLLVVVHGSTKRRYERAQDAYRAVYGVDIPLEIVVLTRSEFERELPAAASLAATVAREGRVLYDLPDKERLRL